MLDYRGITEPEPLGPARREVLFKVTLVCWVVPLFVGVADFLTWLIGRFWICLDIGWITIAVGTLMAFVGSACTLAFVIKRWRSERKMREVIVPALLLAGLLVSNFFVAILLINFWIAIAKPHHGLP
jgi:hypothetical protein